MKRVLLHVIAEMGVGGAEAVVVELTGRGSSIGWESVVISAGGGRVPIIESGGTEHVKMPLIGRSPIAFLKAVQELRRAITSKQPDALITHNVVVTLATYVARWASRSHPPIISVFHGVKDGHYIAAARVFRACSDHVVAVSAQIRTRLIGAGLPGDSVRVIRNAVSTPHLVPRDAARRVLGFDSDVPLALCIARLAPQKRHDVLLRAWAQLPGKAILLLAGDGEDRAQLQLLAKDLGLTTQVQFLGNRTDINMLLSAADLSVLASDWEGLPIALLESMAGGLAVVSTDVDGVAEVVLASEGILVPRGDSTRLSRAIAELLFDPVKRRRYGRAAKVGVTERFNPQIMVDQYERLCHEATAAG